MVFKFTVIFVTDNSGGQYVKCIHCYTRTLKGCPPDEVLVSMRVCFPKKKVRKGILYRGVLVRVASNLICINGPFWFKYKRNALILLNKRLLPIGTRFKGPIPAEVRKKQYAKLIAFATIIV
jgi:large subunit ribosomal protein L14